MIENNEIRAKALEVPQWLKGGAVYQINPRTFCESGDINGVRKELPFLKSLGFKTVYLCPIFEEDDSPDRAFWSKRQCASNTNNPKNPYRINNYFRIDEEYGSAEDLYALVREAHALDMKVLLDLVYMHIGPHSNLLERHPEFAMRDDEGNIKYTTFNFPFINFDSEGLREYLWSNMTYFVGELDVDGFRCDVGDMVPDDFWVEGRRRIKVIKPDAVLINEGGKFERLSTSFDACYSFEWHNDIMDVLLGKITAKQAVEKEKCRQAKVPENGYLLRDMDNHDTVTDWYTLHQTRVETLAGHDGMELITVMNYALSGIPMIYCGNELADEAKLSMFANRFYMGEFQVTDREAMKKTEASARRQSVFTKLNRLLLEKDAMQSADMEWLECESDNLIVFKKKGTEHDIVFACNFGADTEELDLNKTLKDVLMDNLAELDGQKLTLKSHGYILAEI